MKGLKGRNREAKGPGEVNGKPHVRRDCEATG